MTSGYGVGLLAGLATLVSVWAAAAQEPPASDTLPITFGDPFALVDEDGAARTERDFAGRFLLVYFGYTTCPDICPTNLTAMASALDAVGAAGQRVQPLLISVDPGRDTPARLKAFTAKFHPRLIGLTGSESQIRAVARAYRVSRGKVSLPDPGDADGYLILHSPTTFLMGPDGRFLTLFPHGTDGDAMARTLANYLR